ncbi:hypothetical protein [Streptomyces sp. NPDC007264]|uniref:hypothetical protein n=1 Tax=Streptomyces sp. NPDC007264 TaxID=3364777 RepID=UPI0036DF9B09
MTIVRRRAALIAGTMLLAGAASSGVAMASTPSVAPTSVQTNDGHGDHDRGYYRDYGCWNWRYDGYRHHDRGCYRFGDHRNFRYDFRDHGYYRDFRDHGYFNNYDFGYRNHGGFYNGDYGGFFNGDRGGFFGGGFFNGGDHGR